MFSMKDCEKSIDYLLENAGPVIRYRLRRDILHDLSAAEEETLLERIVQLPWYRLVESYVKPNGYIGNGMHSHDHWRGQVLHETPLQDGENAARLLSVYHIPKTWPIVSNFVAAMRDETVLQKEFTCIPPEIPRFQNRFLGLHNGNCLMAMLYAMQAMLGYGDDYEDLREFQNISLKGFQRVQALSSLEEITKPGTRPKSNYNYPYIEAEEYFPDVYTLEMLAYSQSWRNEKNVALLADALNHINAIMKPDTNIHVKIAGKYYAPCFAFVRPLRAFSAALIDTITYRRTLTEIAMTGAGERVDILRESVANVLEAMDADGILRMRFDVPHNRHYSPKALAWPGAYSDVRLEEDYRDPKGMLCDLTFWAVEFLYLCHPENTI